jgi:sec-independent protein translocase protein TatA
MFGLGYRELLLILVIVLILFGAQRLDLAKSLGSSVKEFKKGINEVTKDDTASAAKEATKKEDEKKACGSVASASSMPLDRSRQKSSERTTSSEKPSLRGRSFSGSGS